MSSNNLSEKRLEVEKYARKAFGMYARSHRERSLSKTIITLDSFRIVPNNIIVTFNILESKLVNYKLVVDLPNLLVIVAHYDISNVYQEIATAMLIKLKSKLKEM